MNIKSLLAGFSTAINIALAVIGLFLSLGMAIFAFVERFGWFTTISPGFFTAFCAKTIWDFAYVGQKLHREVGRLEGENDQLEKSVNELMVTKKKLGDDVVALEKNLKVASANGEKLEKNVIAMTQDLARQKSITDQLGAELKMAKDQSAELTRMLENSKKLVTNLILAGDDYKNFNKKFSANLTDLGETSADLKKTTELLGRITNSLAKHVPEDKLADAKFDQNAKNFKGKVVKLVSKQSELRASLRASQITLVGSK